MVAAGDTAVRGALAAQPLGVLAFVVALVAALVAGAALPMVATCDAAVRGVLAAQPLGFLALAVASVAALVAPSWYYFPPARASLLTMAEPTEAEIAGFASVRSLCDWAGITEDNRDTLLAGLGCDEGDSFRPIGSMAVDDYDAVVDTLVINGQPPTLYVLAGWKLVGQVARLSSGATPTRAQRQGPPFAKAGQPLLTSVHGVKVGIIKLATTGDQGLDDEVITVSEADLQEAVSPEELDAYHIHIADYASRYSDRCWPTVYQADVRRRQERMQTICRRGMQLHDADPQATIRAGLDENKPWRYVWTQAVPESSFRLKEIREKCLLPLTKVSTAPVLLDGDVRVGGSGSQASAAQLAPEGRARSPKRAARQPPVRTREDNANDDGTLKTNRPGKEWCKDFQIEDCESPPGAPGNRPRDRRRVHQCAMCLSQDHGAHHPAECPKTAPRPSLQPKGRGQGGGGRGGGRRGGRY